MVGDMVNVMVAAVDWPGLSLVPVLSIDTVIGPLAFAGFQFEVVNPNDNYMPLPVFLM
jgi:hypothetical protein